MPDRGLIFWQASSNAIILDDSVPADCLEEVVHCRTGEILYQKIRLSPRPPPKVILKSVWQVEQESIGRRMADQVTVGLEVDLRYQGIPPEEPQQGEEHSRKQYIGKLVRAISSHPKMHRLLNCKALSPKSQN